MEWFSNCIFGLMVLVTGATGLVGSHLVFDLLQKGYHVRGMYRNQNKIKRVEQLVHYYAPEEARQLLQKMEWFKGDVKDIDSITTSLHGCTEVYHTAALVSFNKKDYNRLLATNKYGTANVVNCALDQGIRKFGFVSSTAAIGTPRKGCASEKDLWKSSSQHSNYSVTKYMAEMEVWRGANEGLNVCIVNPSIIIGPGDLQQSSTHLFHTIQKGLTYYPPGSNAFVDVRDVSALLIQMMENETYNERVLAVGENLPFLKVFQHIAESLGVKPPSKRLPKWLSGMAWRIELLRSVFSNQPPRITKESTDSAYSQKCYSNQKAKAMGFEFKTIHEAVVNTVGFID